MRLRQHASSAFCGALCGVAAWTSSGVLGLDTLAGPLRILGLLPSFATLAMALVVGAMIAVSAGSRGVPAFLFLLPIISSLAWTTVVGSPGIVAWAGPSAIIPFTLLAIGALVSVLATKRDVSWRRLLTRHLDSRWSPSIAATATALWLLALLMSATSLPLTGDEPLYLLVTQSILEDGDLDLTNNYDAETYRAFYPGTLERHVTMGYLAEQYSFHGPALSVLLIPGLALGGVLASRLLIVLVTALGAGFFWSAARRVTDSGPAAWMGWLAMVSAAPFALHGILIYPDGLAASVTSFATWVLVTAALGLTSSTLAVVGAGLALATLPWFHIRMSLTAGVFGLAIVWVLAQRRRDLILPFLAAPTISFVLWIASTWVMFHTLDPTAAFRTRAGGSLTQTPIGTLGLLFDAEYGLLTYAPVLIFSVVGVAALWKRSAVLAMVCAALTVATLELGAAWVWWGGDSAPARFLVPVIPLIALCLAAWWTSASSRARSFAAVALVMGAYITASLACAEGGLYIPNAPDGRATIWEWLSPNVDVALALPSLFRPGARPGAEAMVAASWIALGVIAFALTTSWRRQPAGAISDSWLSASVALVAWLTVGASVVWWQRDAAPWTPDRGQLRMLHAATSASLSVGVHGAGWHENVPMARPHFTTPISVVSSLSISTPAVTATPIRLHVPFVPAGRYAIDVEQPATMTSQPPRLSLELGRDARRPFATWLASTTVGGPTFSLAVPIWAVRVISDSASGAIGTVRLRAERVTRPPRFVDGYALLATNFGSLVAYSMDPYSFTASNGIGLAPDRQGSLIIADEHGRSTSFVLLVQSGPVTTTVTFERGSFRRTVSVGPMATEQISVPQEPDDLIPLRFITSGESWSQDNRRLSAIVGVLPQ